MCTAIAYKHHDLYFGRTLDHTCSFGEEIVIVPRNFPLLFREMGTLHHHYAIIGMAHVAEGIPLFYDAMNEKGLAIAGLHFDGFARYRPSRSGMENIAHFELICWLLSQCASTDEAVRKLRVMNITEAAFSRSLSPAPLHWLIADKEKTVTLEAVEEGLKIYENPVGVLTNNPPFPQQLFQLRNFMHLSAGMPHNHFSKELELEPYSYGMGAMGLPGDLSSPSRFVRAAFTKFNSFCGPGDDPVGQFFHILGTAEQPRGCTRVEDDSLEYTLYTACCDTARGIYHYSTYENRQICAVDMHREDLNGRTLSRYPLLTKQHIYTQNGGHEAS